MRLTRIGGPTVLVELGGWRLLIDPTFDEAGRRYSFGLGTSSVKTRGPALPADEVGRPDVILLSHDHHSDNLDDAGRALLPTATHVITTRSGARRLSSPTTRGLRAGESMLLEGPDKEAIRIAATPARHGPSLTRAIVGEVVGFTVRRASRESADLWVTGDSVLTRRLRRFARRTRADVAIINAGGVRFASTGPLEYTMTGRDVVTLIGDLQPRIAVPAHYDGWSHFRDGEEGLRLALDNAPPDVRAKVRWLPDGTPVDVGEPRRRDGRGDQRPVSAPDDASG
ncbi:MBL fold metallo-hydrolase [Microbacterium sp. BK668]|uniref:MBL fold metallo-hydrolase n=1 Tax=Microbacterium sp. BK668 TaxID=2512118 RepID=UPI0010EC0843|nr:MBL fold metallo-hydrolase [Microbacterium sp. BK668]TDN91828.1 L-ascorbate metabolism protein UlaG (beta-lactamase superfamily) [Microbacterium sp. BK668]